ncbi:hypothetical protein [Lacrimispora brassicae]
MYKIIDESGQLYSLLHYEREVDFERMIVQNANTILGTEGIYFDIKKLIGKSKKGASIPDGYYLDLTFHNDPKLYLVEIELKSHDVYGHIGDQILRFGISSEMDKYKMKSILLDSIGSDDEKKEKLYTFLKRSRYSNVNELLDQVIFDNRPSTIVIIDEATEELSRVMAQLTMATEVIEAQTYICGEKKLHRFTPFKDDLLDDLPTVEDADQLDTVVVPAREEGFNDEFIKNNRWYAIRISSAMIDKIKYVASYQVAPVSAITYMAEVARIEKYEDSNKYIIYFKEGTLKKISAVGLGQKRALAPQAPRYSAYKTILNAKTLDDIWD